MTQTSPSRARPALRTEAARADKDLGLLVADGVVVAIGLVTVAVLSLFFDARTAIAVAALPRSVVQVGSYTSLLGLSGYMFAIAALVVLCCTAGLRIERFRCRAMSFAVLRDRALYIIAVLAISGIAAQVFKHMIGRARPMLMGTLGPYHFDLLSMKASLASFPSGHTTTVFAMAVGLGYFVPRARLPLFAFASVIGLSRIVVDAHYVSDVVGGAVLGIVSAVLVTHVFADWAMAFAREAGGIVVRGRGTVTALLRSGAPS